MEITVVELTKEELDEIMAKRKKEEERLLALDLLDEIKERIAIINKLGYHVRLPEIGGSYVSRHRPEATVRNTVITHW